MIVREVLKYMSKSDIERMWYEDEILAEIDREAEIDYKLKEQQKTIAIKAIKKGLSLSDIADLTNLDIEFIKELQEELEEDKLQE